MANLGKEFEKQFKESSKGLFLLRIPDSAIGFNVQASTQRFAGKTPYDFLLYKRPTLYALELKSTGTTSISFKGSSPMIKSHQIKELNRAKSQGAKAGFIFNFRKTNHTYYVPIEVFEAITNFGMSAKSSINENDILDWQMTHDIITIPQRLKKVNYSYDLSVLFKEET